VLFFQIHVIKTTSLVRSYRENKISILYKIKNSHEHDINSEYAKITADNISFKMLSNLNASAQTVYKNKPRYDAI
jgi:hypothetical protein